MAFSVSVPTNDEKAEAKIAAEYMTDPGASPAGKYITSDEAIKDSGLEVFLKGKLCVDDGEILGSGGESTLGYCYGSCKATAGCEYIGFTRGEHSWCIRYKACTPRNTSDPSYTVYRMTPSKYPNLRFLVVVSVIRCNGPHPLSLIMH